MVARACSCPKRGGGSGISKEEVEQEVERLVWVVLWPDMNDWDITGLGRRLERASKAVYWNIRRYQTPVEGAAGTV